MQAQIVGFITQRLVFGPRCEQTSSGFPTRSEKNRAAQQQKMVRDSKFRILKVERLYYLCGESKDADQLRSYCAADLRLCFAYAKKNDFLIRRLI